MDFVFYVVSDIQSSTLHADEATDKDASKVFAIDADRTTVVETDLVQSGYPRELHAYYGFGRHIPSFPRFACGAGFRWH